MALLSFADGDVGHCTASRSMVVVKSTRSLAGSSFNLPLFEERPKLYGPPALSLFFLRYPLQH